MRSERARNGWQLGGSCSTPRRSTRGAATSSPSGGNNCRGCASRRSTASRPTAKLQAYKRRMGWSVPWASSGDSDFNYDFQAAYTEEQQQSGVIEYNFRAMDVRPSLEAGEESLSKAEIAAGAGTDWATYRREEPGVSAFALDKGVVYHTYSAYARGLDGLWGMYQWLDRAPRGRNETGAWWRRHDEYGKG